MPKTISIITPTFNSEAGLEKCILSVKNQTYPHIEHVIVDGLSKDGTVDLIKKYAGTYNMKWVSEKDSGVADAMGKGFKMAEGQIFTWIDSDNFYLEPTFIEQVMRVFNEKEDTGIVLTNCYSKYELSEKMTVVNPPNTITYDKLLNEGSMFTPECVYFTRELFFNAGGFNLQNKLLADYELWLNIFKQDPVIVRLPIISIIYVSNEDSLLHRKPIQAWQEGFRIGKAYNRKLSSRFFIRIRYAVFLIRYPIIKFIKRHPKLRDFFVKHFR